MNMNVERIFATVLGGATALAIPVSAAMAQGSPMGTGGMMGDGSHYGHMYGFSGAWLVALVVLALGIALVAVLRKSR